MVGLEFEQSILSSSQVSWALLLSWLDCISSCVDGLFVSISISLGLLCVSCGYPCDVVLFNSHLTKLCEKFSIVLVSLSFLAVCCDG